MVFTPGTEVEGMGENVKPPIIGRLLKHRLSVKKYLSLLIGIFYEHRQEDMLYFNRELF
jgi:hypothetical protein